MYFLYSILINLIIIFSPIILLVRILQSKEDKYRFMEKFSFPSKKRAKGKLVWFHGSSVGEINSIIPLIEKFEKNKTISQILITSNTLSSSKILKKYNFKKAEHQFFPIDKKFLVTKFLNYWRPNILYLIESEIWPNMIYELKRKKIPLILLNARITKKSFERWLKIKSLSEGIFKSFNLCISQNNESINYLRRLGAKKIIKLGNLKYSELENLKLNKLKQKTHNFLKNRKILFSCISTHKGEEDFCAKLHLKLKEIYPNILTIVIPRHISRKDQIIDFFNNLNIKSYCHSSKQNIKKNTEIYIVDTFGETKKFLNYSKTAFIGGSLVKHGGQNPLEAARMGCRIIHGPYVDNFKEIYSFLRKKNISKLIKSKNAAATYVYQNYRKTNISDNRINLKNIGKKILIRNYNALTEYL